MNKNSKYLRKNNEEKNKQKCREYPFPQMPAQNKDGRHYPRPSGQKRYEMLVERERIIAEAKKGIKPEEEELLNPDITVESAPEEPAETEAAPVAEAEKELREVSRPKTAGAVFNKKANEGFKPRPDLSVDEPDNYANGALVRTVISCGILSVAAVVLQFASFRLPLMPIFIRLDLSAIPELLAAVAFGPLAGMLVILVKNIVYVAAYHSTVLSTALSNIISDSLFVIIASLIYARGMFSQKAMEKMFEQAEFTKDKRAFQIIKSGIAASIVTSVANFFLLKYVTYPLIFKLFKAQGITKDIYIKHYQLALATLKGYIPQSIGKLIPDIDSITKGILIYNIPITFAKMLFVTLVVAVVYRFLSDFFHYRSAPQ